MHQYLKSLPIVRKLDVAVTKFLTTLDVLEIHDRIIDNFGGAPKLRDVTLLESALAQPGMVFSGKFMHSTLHEKAAAYLFHITKNHPFVDGNKRTAVVTYLVFLQINNCYRPINHLVLYELAVGIAASQITKAEIATILRHQN